MKPAYLLMNCTVTILIGMLVEAQPDNIFTLNEGTETSEVTPVSGKKHLNFFIVSKRHKGKLDLASRFNVLRTKLKSLFRQKKFVSIIAGNAEQMSQKVQYRLRKYNAQIGTIWFDSHGKYKKGYSLFYIGNDEFSYKSLKNPELLHPLKQLSQYIDQYSNIVIGSCYGGATYYRSSIDYKDTTRMNGDSLMIGMGEIFKQARIYACQSWVMTKPGLFLKRASVAGSPGRKLFRDICYQPVWMNLGKWNEYISTENCFNSINPVTLDMYGNLIVRSASYINQEKVKKGIKKNMDSLKPGLYK